MTRKDVIISLAISAAALCLYVGVKIWLGGSWDWVTFIIWFLAALMFGFGIIYAKSFLIRLVDEISEGGAAPQNSTPFRKIKTAAKPTLPQDTDSGPRG